jgi:hypothetical protein
MEISTLLITIAFCAIGMSITYGAYILTKN